MPCFWTDAVFASQACEDDPDPGGPETYLSADTPMVIPDESFAESTITIAGRPEASITATVEVHVVITHTYTGDLSAYLTSPSLTQYSLFDFDGAGENVDTVFEIDVTDELVNGQWVLRVSDAAAGDEGTIETWSVTI